MVYVSTMKHPLVYVCLLKPICWNLSELSHLGTPWRDTRLKVFVAVSYNSFFLLFSIVTVHVDAAAHPEPCIIMSTDYSKLNDEDVMQATTHVPTHDKDIYGGVPMHNVTFLEPEIPLIFW